MAPSFDPIVRPYDHPRTEQKIKLTIGDIYSPKLWAKQAYFIPLKDDSTAEKCYQVMREGLSRTIADVPRASGQVKRGEKKDDPRELYIHVNEHAHAKFYYQDLSEDASLPSYAAMRAKGFPLDFELGVKLSCELAFGPVIEGDIQIIGMLTKLKGGLCLSTGQNHVITDGAALATIERLWALHTADVSAGKPMNWRWGKLDDPKEVEFLSTPKEGAGEYEDENAVVLPAAMAGLNLPLERPEPQESIQKLREARAEAAEEPDDEFRWAIYHFSPESQRRLRKDAARPDAPQPASRAAAVGGLFWTRSAFIKQQTQEGDEESQLYFPINIRHRLNPPINANMVASVMDIVPSKLDLKTLEANDSSALITAASTLSQSVNAWSQKKWEAWLTTAATIPPDQAIGPNPLVMLASTNIIFNDYSRTTTNIMDWGSDVGMIERARYPRPPAGPAMAIRVHPGLPDGGIEVAVSGRGALLEALAKDEVFSKYAKMVCYPG